MWYNIVREKEGGYLGMKKMIIKILAVACITSTTFGIVANASTNIPKDNNVSVQKVCRAYASDPGKSGTVVPD